MMRMMKYKGREKEYKLEWQRNYRREHREEVNAKAREYTKNRYHNDQEYRKRTREHNNKANRKWRKLHPEKNAASQKKYYEKNKKEKSKYNRKYRETHYYEILKDSSSSKREIRRKVKGEILYLLGGRCVHCGESDWRCLQIDHINGGGNKERKRMNHSYYEKMILEKIKSGSKDYQLLCANCNWKKKYEKHEV